MTTLVVVVEGQSEEAFVNRLLRPLYAGKGIYLRPFLIQTSRAQSGGIHAYPKVKPQIERLCREAGVFVTTLFDLYALPNSFPGKDSAAYRALITGRRKAEFLEQKWHEDMGRNNFIPNLIVHEFEALLFSDIDAIEGWKGKKELKALRAIIEMAGPEDINDGSETAPSKRLKAAVPGYRKTSDGPQIAIDIGLDKIRANCPHFDGWLRKIDALVPH